MITAVDTNILLDLLLPDEQFGDEAEQKLVVAARAGVVIISEAVIAELTAHIGSLSEVEQFFDESGIKPDPSGIEALCLAGIKWREYTNRRTAHMVCDACGMTQKVSCERCGATVSTRQHVVADFMIGAHASVQADRLLTRDRGYYGTYFPELSLV